MDALPRLVDALIKDLDREIPKPDVRPGVSHEQNLFDAGARSVVELLRRLQAS